MSIEDILNENRVQTNRAVNQRKHTRYGIVDSYDKEQPAYKVKFQPEGTLSGWIPIASSSTGDTEGLFTPVKPGAMVSVEYETGDFGSAVVRHIHWNDEDAPLEVEAGEKWHIHSKHGGYIFDNDGQVKLAAAGYVKPKQKQKQQGGASGGGSGGGSGSGGSNQQSFDKDKGLIQFDKEGKLTSTSTKDQDAIHTSGKDTTLTAKNDTYVKPGDDGKVYLGKDS